MLSPRLGSTHNMADDDDDDDVILVSDTAGRRRDGRAPPSDQTDERGRKRSRQHHDEVTLTHDSREPRVDTAVSVTPPLFRLLRTQVGD